MTVTITGAPVVTQVNTNTLMEQESAQVSALTGGGYVIAWESWGGIVQQRFNAAGAPVGGEVVIGSAVDYDLTSLAGGGWIVALQGFQASGRIYSSTGVAQSPQAITSTYAMQARVAGLADGGYVVVWYARADDTGLDVRVRRYDASGAQVGADSLVNTTTAGDQSQPAVAALADGGFVVTWQGFGGLFGQRYDSSGLMVGAEFQLAASFSGFIQPQVIGLSGGGFLAYWQQHQTGPGMDIYGRLYNAAGAALGPATRLHESSAGDQTWQSAAPLTDGGFVLAWHSLDGAHSIRAQAFDAAGVRVGTERLVTSSLSQNDVPDVAGLPGGGYVVAWNGYSPGTGQEIYRATFGLGVVGNVLSANVESASGDAADDTFLGAPSAFNPLDEINGGGGTDTIRLTAAGVADFTGIALSNVERIEGSAGDDTLIFTDRLPSGVSFLSGGGTDTLVTDADVDLSALSLSGAFRVTANAGVSVTHRMTDVSQIGLSHGLNSTVTVDASSLNLTPEQRAQLFSQGVDYVIQQGGGTFAATGQVLSTGSAIDIDPANWEGEPSVAGLANGNFAVAWYLGGRVFVQVFDGSGAGLTGRIDIGSATGGLTHPAVAALTDGGFVVAWDGVGIDGDGWGVRAHRFDATGAPSGSAFTVNAITFGSQVEPSATGTVDGGFVIGWRGPATGSGWGGGMQRFASDGARLGGEVAVAGPPEVLALSGGGYVALGGGVARVFNSGGVPAGDPIALESTAENLTGAALAGGGFGVLWTEYPPGVLSGPQLIRLQLFTSTGAKVGPEVAIGSSTGLNLSLAALEDGGYLVSWADTQGIYSRRFDAAGAEIGTVSTLSSAGFSTVAADGLQGGGFVTAWLANQHDLQIQVTQQIDYRVLTSGADSVAGGGGITWVETTPQNLGSGDNLAGGGGSDALILTGSGTLDLTAPGTFGGFETVLGAGGDDTFVISNSRLAGITRIDGREGVDTLMVSAAGGPSGSEFTDSVVFDLGNRLFTLERLVGSDQNDTFVFSSSSLSGFTRVDGGAGQDAVSFAGATVGQTVSLSSSLFLNIERLVGSAFDDGLTGDSQANLLWGGDGSDVLNGGLGADGLYGGAGDDIYVVNVQADLAFEDAGQGLDAVVATSGYYLFANIENLTLVAGAGSIFGVGNELANGITGNEGDNLLIAGAGEDVVLGSAGNDSLFGQDGDDVLNGGSGVDYVVGGAGDDAMSGGNQSDAVYGEDGDDLVVGGGGFSTDILVGGAGDDSLDGDSGLGDYDLMDGGAGNDGYFVDTPDDLTFEAAGGGLDFVVARISGAGYYLYPNVEDLFLEGETPFGVGNELDNILIGSPSGNYLLGGAGNDTLIGEGGNDVLFGEAGADVFVFERGTGGDAIGDFAVGVDRMDLRGLGFSDFAQVQANMVQNGNVSAINLGEGDFIIIHNVAMNAFSAGDFVL